MPMYEYECQQCHKRTEKIQKFNAEPLTECPFCGGHLERTITAPAVQFAGGGWYKDLYSSAKPTGGSREGKSGEGREGGAESSPKAESGGAGSSDSAGSSAAPAASATPAAAPAPSTPAAKS